jgi:hypothetical protein
MNVVILEDAADDIEAARSFYNSLASSLGECFAQAIITDLISLQIFAGVHRSHCGFQRMLSKRFPFGIYYEVEGETEFLSRRNWFRSNPAFIIGIIVIPRAAPVRN